MPGFKNKAFRSTNIRDNYTETMAFSRYFIKKIEFYTSADCNHNIKKATDPETTAMPR